VASILPQTTTSKATIAATLAMVENMSNHHNSDSSTEVVNLSPTSVSGGRDDVVGQKGVAGRINYATWDKVATELVQQVEEEDKQEKAEETRKVSFS
jgi:hypothetical protein